MKIYKGNREVTANASFCSGFNSFLGLRFRKQLEKDEALVIEVDKESRLDAAIDMLFVFYPIDVIWLDRNKKVVDKRNVKPFSLLSIPRKPAKYVIEVMQGVGSKFNLNDKVKFKNK